tara:strand:- start:1811 stop:2263 length:453 start_codon:yes stop_codon:yes gene_type:complete
MSINTSTQSGFLGNDAQLIDTNGGGKLLSFPLATTSGFGQNKKTAWVQIKMFGKICEHIHPMLNKGVKVVITGQLAPEEWEKDGIKRHKTTILANDIEIMASSEGAPKPAQQEQQQQAPVPQQQSAPLPQFSKTEVKQDIAMDFEDDIPF